MKTIAAITLAGIAFLLSCSPAQVRRESGPDPLDLGDFQVVTPAPKNWIQEVPPAKWEHKIEEYNGLKRITFTKVFRTALGEFRYSDMISIIQNNTREETWGTPASTLADMFRDNELTIMAAEGVNQGLYELKEVTRYEKDLAGLRLHCMSYVKWIGGNWGPNTESGLLALYFPESYQKDHIFYMFLASHLNNASGGKFHIDEVAFNEVLQSFRLRK